MQRYQTIGVPAHACCCDVRPTGSGLTLSGESERVRFQRAWRMNSSGLTALYCLKASGTPWVGFMAGESGMSRLIAVLRLVGAQRGVWITAHLVESEINLVGAIDVEAA